MTRVPITDTQVKMATEAVVVDIELPTFSFVNSSNIKLRFETVLHCASILGSIASLRETKRC